MVTVEVTGTDHAYWAYFPNSPINRGISWGDMDTPDVVNESSWLPGSYDHRGAAKPEEEGKKFTNYTVRMQGIPICMGNGIHHLNITFQFWLSLVSHSTAQNFHDKFYMFHPSAFRGQEINAARSINLPSCEMWLTNKDSDWVH